MNIDALVARKEARTSALPYPSATGLQKLVITMAKKTKRAWLDEVGVDPLIRPPPDLDTACRNSSTP